MKLPIKIYNTFYKLRNNNPIANEYFRNKRMSTLNREFLNSKDYEFMMTKYAGSDWATDINDAEEMSKNFNYRHKTVEKVLGGWRWKGLWQKRDEILDVVYDEDSKGIDFGGANGPVSLHTTIVDFDELDSFKRKVPFKNLDQIDYKLDYIFSSHTLEHVKELDQALEQMKEKLKRGGKIIFHVPSYTCKRWNSGIHDHKTWNRHEWTFYLSETPFVEGIENPLHIDKAVGKYFSITEKCYLGDNSILILGHKE